MADTLFKNATVYSSGKLSLCDVLVSDGIIAAVGQDLCRDNCEIADLTGLYLLPGFTDVHVHLREPGFSYKETVSSGTAAAAHGGAILLESREGQGMRVTASLPLKKPGKQTLHTPRVSAEETFSPLMTLLSDALPWQVFEEK